MRRNLNPGSWDGTFHSLSRWHWNIISQGEEVKFISKVEMWRNIHRVIKEGYLLYKINKHVYFYLDNY